MRSRSCVSCRWAAWALSSCSTLSTATRDLLGHLLHEAKLGFVIDPPLLAAEPHGAEPPQRRRQGNRTKRLNAILQQQRRQRRGNGSSRDISSTTNGCLSFPHIPAGRSVDGQFQTRADRAGFRRHQKMQPHHVARWIMQHEIDVIERDDPRQPLGEIMKQLAQIAVRRNGFGHLQQQCQAGRIRPGTARRRKPPVRLAAISGIVKTPTNQAKSARRSIISMRPDRKEPTWLLSTTFQRTAESGKFEYRVPITPRTPYAQSSLDQRAGQF